MCGEGEAWLHLTGTQLCDQDQNGQILTVDAAVSAANTAT